MDKNTRQTIFQIFMTTIGLLSFLIGSLILSIENLPVTDSLLVYNIASFCFVFTIIGFCGYLLWFKPCSSRCEPDGLTRKKNHSYARTADQMINSSLIIKPQAPPTPDESDK